MAARQIGDPRSQHTRAALIECAESLIGELGVNGVSIRQIAKASGSSNPSAISYHFGNKDSLLKAIIDYRLPVIDHHRGALLREAIQANPNAGLKSLAYALYRPFFDQRDSQGRRSYAAFVAELLRGNRVDIRTSLNADDPVTRDILDRMERSAGHDVKSRFGQRVYLASALVFAALRQIDHCSADGQSDEALFDDAIDAAIAVIDAKI